jgi:asparagine synthase (glutamine-hydrolysing)
VESIGASSPSRTRATTAGAGFRGNRPQNHAADLRGNPGRIVDNTAAFADQQTRRAAPDGSVRMCGVLGAATVRGQQLLQDEALVAETRELLAHRGPDGAGLVHGGHVALAHRRLALLDPAGGVQPFVVDARGLPWAGPNAARVSLAWNGELYGHDALHRSLAARGVSLRTRSDTEALAWLLALDGDRALDALRGMFALAAWIERADGATSLLLARDSFGTIPFHWSRIARGAGFADEIAFASEPRAILAHPGFRIEPDFATLAAYLEMPRRAFGARTLYRNLRALEPGEVLSFDLGEPGLAMSRRWLPLPEAEGAGESLRDAAWRARLAVTESVDLHLVADAPVCTLLSGGIDSTIIGSLVRARIGRDARLVTFAAGAEGDAARPESDLFAARRVAQLLRSEHHEVTVDGESFGARWDELVAHGLSPLATPNEIAISLLGERIAPHAKAALSGEGADELFGGYGPPLEATLAWIEANTEHDAQSAARFYRTAFGWSQRAFVGELLAPGVADAAHGEDPVGAMLVQAFESEHDLGSLDAHLAALRRVNLTNLLERLNLSLMKGSVEGRVPFADRGVLACARGVGAAHLVGGAASNERAGVATATRASTLVTKRVLREAFADVLPPEIVSRPKASFPLPFERWIAAHAHWIDGPVSREVFSGAARELVRTQAAQHWRLAWPMLNAARWLDSVFA